MEQAPTTNETNENVVELSDWRERKEAALNEAIEIAGMSSQEILNETDPVVIEEVKMKIDSWLKNHEDAMKVAKEEPDETAIAELNKDKYLDQKLRELRQDAEIKMPVALRMQQVD